VGRFKTNAQLLPRFRQDVPGAHEPTLPSDSIPTTATFDVVNWNLEFFGARSEDYGHEEYGPADEALQLQNIKTVIQSLHADVIAVQEVSNDALFAELVAQLGSNYTYTCSDRYSYSFQGPSNTFPYQKVCFIYDTATVKLEGARPLFESRYDSARLINPSLLPGIPDGDASSFYSSGRLPYLMTVNATINGVTERISFIDIHAKSGAAVADRARRAYDAAVLKDSLDAHYPGEKFIILGDLNDDLDQSIAPGLPSPYANFVADTAHYAAVTKALSEAGARSTVSFGDMIDHQILSNELKPDYISGSARVITPFLLIPNYPTTTTDHLAVMTRYVFRGIQATFAQAGVTVVESAVAKKVTLSVDKASDKPRTIQLTLSGTATYGKDFTTQPKAVNGVVRLTLPANATSVTLQTNVLQDVIDELDETAVFTVVSAGGITAGAQPDFTLTIQDNDVPVISFAELLATAKEGSGEYKVRFKLSTPPATDQQVTVFVHDGQGVTSDDYVTSPAAQSGKIVLDVPAGSKEVYFTVDPQEDARRELPEILTFYMSGTTSGLQQGGVQLSIFTILDVPRRHPQFAVFPNPTTGPVRILAQDVDCDEMLQAELRNPDGGVLYSGAGTIEQLSQAVSAKIHSGKRGFYTLKIVVDGDTFTLRILRI
jgi:endonuclease/exonuclease/phosphatase family metal-dependent hydrolase